MDPKLLYPLKHRGEESRAHMALIRSRQALVDCRTQLVNHVRETLKSFGRAVVATARKLAVLMHSLWVSGEIYEPLRNAHRALEARRLKRSIGASETEGNKRR